MQIFKDILYIVGMSAVTMLSVYYGYDHYKSTKSNTVLSYPARTLDDDSCTEKEKPTKIVTLKNDNTIVINGSIKYCVRDDFYKIIKKIPGTTKINLILSTTGGLLSDCQNILKLLLNHPAGFDVYIKHYAMSGGTIIALGAKEIIMDKHSLLGKIDALHKQDEEYSTHAIIRMDPNKKYKHEYSKYTINLIEYLVGLTSYPSETKGKIKQEMLYSEYIHCRMFDFDECLKIGLNVRRPKDDELELLD